MSILSPNPQIVCREIQQQQLYSSGTGAIWVKSKGLGFDRSRKEWSKRGKRDLRGSAFWPELFKPSSVEMEPIQDCEHFDQILETAKDLSQPVLVDWMAAWCRKCIYLKPKLEKLAADYDTKVKFYCVDVNNVPQSLVKRGNISGQRAGHQREAPPPAMASSSSRRLIAVMALLISPALSQTCKSPTFSQHHITFANSTDHPTLKASLHWLYEPAVKPNPTLSVAVTAPTARWRGR